jgi:hypothetical protein
MKLKTFENEKLNGQRCFFFVNATLPRKCYVLLRISVMYVYLHMIGR